MADTDDEQGFCSSPVWDEELTWNSTDPDFTPCFQKTVLALSPVAFLLLLAPYKLFTLCHLQNRIIKWNWLNCSKLVLSGLIGVLMAVHCIGNVVERSEGVTVPPVNFVSPILILLAMAVVSLFIVLEKRKGIRTSGYLLLFWLLLLVTGIFIFRSLIRHAVLEGKVEKKLEFVTFTIYFVLVIASFVLSALVDKRPEFEEVQQDANPCPESSASFLSRITFWWFTGLVIEGYKRALVRENLWSLNKEDTSASLKESYDKQWQAQANKIKRKRAMAGANGVQTEAVFRDGSVTTEVKVVDGSEHKKPSLLKTLIVCFAPSFFVAMGFKLIHDILMFINPQLLKLLIQFTADKDEYTWRGYLYAVLLLVVALIQSLILHQYFHSCLVLGMRLRSVIISAVYRKTLQLSNSAKKKSTVGEIVNLMSVDAQRFMDLMTYFHTIWSGPFQIIVSLYFLWQILGPSVLAGIGVMILLIPVNAFLAHLTRKLQVKQMNLKDSRIKQMNEVLNGIKVLKLYAWETSFQEKVLAIRNKELEVLKKAAYLNACSSFTWTLAPFMVSLVTFAVYTLSDSDNILDAKKAFVSLSLFNIMRFPLTMLPNVITNIVQASVSLKRLQRFLNNDDLDLECVQHNPSAKLSVKIENGTFTWDRDAPNTLTDICMEVEEGSLVAVVGAVGMGKSSLVSALLGEMDKLSGTVSVKGSVAYVAQQAWIQNATVRDNILFNHDFNQQKYDSIVEGCALPADLDMLPAGDQTEIGEKGINLSGGQKQRVSLARAVYHDADVYLLDDPLSAVDSHVGKHLFDHIIGPGGLLKGKTRILVTHSISFLSSVDKIVVMKEGKISESGSFTQLMDHNGAFAEFLRNYLTEEIDEISSADDTDMDVLSLRDSIIQQMDIISKAGTESVDKEGAASASGALLQRQITNLSERVRTITGSQASLTSAGKDVSAKPEVKDKASEEEKEKIIKEEAQQKDTLIQAESVETGRVKFAVFKAYISAVGALLSLIIVFFYVLYNATSVYSNFWLSEWSNDARMPNGTNDKDHRNMRLGVYGALGCLQGAASLHYHRQDIQDCLERYLTKRNMKIQTVLADSKDEVTDCHLVALGLVYFRIAGTLVMLSVWATAIGGVVASRTLFSDLLTSLLHCPLSFYDVTPLGRVLNRCCDDIDEVDFVVPFTVRSMINGILQVFSTGAVIMYTTPLAVCPIPPLAVSYFVIQRFYVATSRQLKRLESTSRSPIYSHFGETITGAVTIRAFSQQERFIQQSESKVDDNQACYYPSIVSNRWLAIRLEFVGNCIIFFASLFAVLGRDDLSPGIVGLSVSYAMNVTQTLNWMVRMTCELETNIVAVERVMEYTETPKEAEWDIADKKPDAAWPQKGVISFSNYQVRYREGLDLVLKGINCSIKSGEKIGIVGRTGAGKSSLTLALFRIIEAAGGEITLDGINISDIGLHDLRSKLTIIPQDPVVFSGSLRMNIDPFEQYTDEQLWQALEHAHLKDFVQGLQAGLQHECTEGGENLSVGQRQLLCLARALLRKTKVLILDEATAAVDLVTDDLIQGTIRTEFAECTVLTIAHRLNTIMDYTRLMVLDKGKIAEFDTPHALLQNPDSIFYGMAKDAGLV